MALATALLWPAQAVSAQDSTRQHPNEAMKNIALDEVVVTATGTEHTLKSVPVQTEIISGRALKSFAGRTIEDILSGLTASFAFGEDDMGSHIQMNGLGNDYILILIDGKRIHGDVGGQNELSLIDPNNIERVEIVRGASSALYGSDAMAGVINIITKKHDEGVLIENTSRFGSYGDVRQHNGVGLRFGKFSSWTNFQLQHSDGWQNTSVEDPNQTEFLITDSRNKTVNRNTNWQLSERLGFSPTRDLELYASGSIYGKRIYRPSGRYAAVDVKTYDLQYSNASAAVGGKWKLNRTDFLTLDVSWDRHAYYYNFTDTTLIDGYINGRYTPYYPYFPGQTDLQSDQQRTLAALKGVFRLPFENTLSAGLEWRYDWLKAPIRVIDGKASDQTAAVFVQDEFGLLDPLQITTGLRVDRNARFGRFKLTPKIAAMLSLGDYRLRAVWSRGFKTPTPKELFYRYVREMAGTHLYLGNTDLRPQTSDYFSFGAEYLGSHGLSLSVTGYYNRLDHMITLVTIPTSQAPGDLVARYDPIKVRQYKNLESARTYGVDISLRYALRAFTIGAGYSYLNTDANLYDATHDRMKSVIIDGTAHHKANAFVTWSHDFSPAYHFTAGLYGRASSKRYYQINGDGKGFQIWRLSTTHDLGRSRHMAYRLEAGVDNLFNYCDRTPHGLHLGTMTPGRTVYASLTVRFAKGKQVKHEKETISNLNSNDYEEN